MPKCEAFRDIAATVLVQFRLPMEWRAPHGIRARPKEAARDRAARVGSYLPMQNVLERNGATLESLWETLRTQGFIPIDAYAQPRETRATEFRASKPYQLLTFVFRDDAVHAKELGGLFRSYASNRYELVSVSKGTGHDGERLISIVSKTIAQLPKSPIRINDPEAEIFGMILTKATPNRPEHIVAQAS